MRAEIVTVAGEPVAHIFVDKKDELCDELRLSRLDEVLEAIVREEAVTKKRFIEVRRKK